MTTSTSSPRLSPAFRIKRTPASEMSSNDTARLTPKPSVPLRHSILVVERGLLRGQRRRFFCSASVSFLVAVCMGSLFGREKVYRSLGRTGPESNEGLEMVSSELVAKAEAWQAV